MVLEPEDQFIGTVNEDFAVESMAGDVFQLGNTSYRILRVERGVVRVEDAHGAAADHSVLAGRGAGRSDELSRAVRACARRCAPASDDPAAAGAALADATRSGLDEPAAAQLVDYPGRGARGARRAADPGHLVLERFFDEVGGMQLVIHAPFGSRINRAWGLALRKRFCRKFNFELQAAATEDAIVLSLTTAHSFPLAEVRATCIRRRVRRC